MDWNSRYQFGDTPWEKGAPHPALLDWLKDNRLAGRVLVPGCGLGHDVRALAAHGVEAVGLDIAAEAVARAGRFPKAGKESYAVGDLFAPPKEWLESFDAVFEHTCFCAIEPRLRKRYVESVHSLLRSGGHLLAIFYLNPGSGEDGPPYGCTTAELDDLLGPRFELVEERAGIATYAGREGREVLRLLAGK